MARWSWSCSSRPCCVVVGVVGRASWRATLIRLFGVSPLPASWRLPCHHPQCFATPSHIARCANEDGRWTPASERLMLKLLLVWVAVGLCWSNIEYEPSLLPPRHLHHMASCLCCHNTKVGRTLLSFLCCGCCGCCCCCCCMFSLNGMSQVSCCFHAPSCCFVAVVVCFFSCSCSCLFSRSCRYPLSHTLLAPGTSVCCCCCLPSWSFLVLTSWPSLLRAW